MNNKLLLSLAAAATVFAVSAPTAQAHTLHVVSLDATASNCSKYTDLGLTKQHCDSMLDTAKKRYTAAVGSGLSAAKCAEQFKTCVTTKSGSYAPAFEGAYLNITGTSGNVFKDAVGFKKTAQVSEAFTHGGYPLVTTKQGEKTTQPLAEGGTYEKLLKRSL